MKIIKQFRIGSRESLDVNDLTRMLFEKVRACFEDVDTLNGGIFLPSRGAFSENRWTCHATITSDMDNSYGQAKDFFDSLSEMVEFFEGDAGQLLEYDDRHIVEDCFEISLPHELDGYEMMVYAAEDENEEEVLAIGVFLRRHRPFSVVEKKAFAGLLDIYGEQLGRTVRICNRLHGLFDEDVVEDDDYAY